MTHRRYIFYDNETRDAGIAIQFYGTATEHIVANNRSWRADGFRAYGFSYTGGVQPNLYLQFLGNEIREGNCYRYDDPLVYPARLSVEGTLPSLHFGSVLRNNHLHNNAQIEVGVGADSDGAQRRTWWSRATWLRTPTSGYSWTRDAGTCCCDGTGPKTVSCRWWTTGRGSRDFRGNETPA